MPHKSEGVHSIAVGRDAREMVDRLLPSQADGGTDATMRRRE